MSRDVARISRVEAERIIAILDDTTEKLGFLDSITPDLLQHRDELSKFIGDEISRTMVEQRSLEKRYEELIEHRAAMKGMVNKLKYKEVQEEIQDVSRSLRESTNNLVRSLKENPNVSGNLIKVQRDRTDLHDLLIRCGQELHDRTTYHTIASKVEEENNACLRLVRLQAREKELRDVVSSLQEDLLIEQRSFAHTASQQKQAISQLKDELLSIRGSTSMDSKFKKKESLASVSAIYRDYKLKERVLETKVKELQDRLKTEQVVHTETREFFTRKQVVVLEEISKWETKYDTEVGIKDDETKDITIKRKKLLERLSVLQKRKNLEFLSDQLEAEKAVQLAAQLKEDRIVLKKQNTAAKVIVREMRVFLQYKKDLDAAKAKAKKEKKIAKDKKAKKK